VEQLNETQKPSNYQAYLLRCWLVGNAWCFSLEAIGHDRQRRGFCGLQDLLTAVANDLEIDNPDSKPISE